MGRKIAKMTKDHCCIPLCNNEKDYNSGKDLSYFNIPRAEKKQKHMLSLQGIIYVEYVVYTQPIRSAVGNHPRD